MTDSWTGKGNMEDEPEVPCSAIKKENDTHKNPREKKSQNDGDMLKEQMERDEGAYKGHT